MAYRKDGIKKILTRFIKEVQRIIPIERVILFGSYAKGNPKKYSDIDIAVISPKFAQMDELERIKLLLDCVHRIKYDFPVDVETFGYTPEEFANATYFDFLGVIKNTGKVIYSS